MSRAILPLVGLLAGILIVLKLTGSLSWPWWLVLSPLWLPPVGYALFAGICVILYAGAMGRKPD
jgi:hypothetical protein